MRSIAAPGRCLGGVFRSALLCIVLLPPSPAKAADVFIATAGTASGSGVLLGDGAVTVRPGLLALHTRVWLRYQDNRVYVMQSEGRRSTAWGRTARSASANMDHTLSVLSRSVP